MKEMFYVVDTNVLIDYPSIIRCEEAEFFEEPSIDLTDAHIIIPTAVVRELSSFKKEISTDRGKAARSVLKRLRKIVENNGHSMRDFYELDAEIALKNGPQKVSILPISKAETKDLPFHPSDADMDGQIILTTIIASNLINAKYFSGDPESDPEIILLTNDNGLAIRAAARGLNTARYSYKPPQPYTGRRDLIVPAELFDQFYNERIITRADWEAAMPSEPPLVANEFIVMTPAGNKYPRGYDENYGYFEYIGRYSLDDDAIIPLSYFSSFPGQLKTAGQAIYAEVLMDPNISVIICTGPAGSGKTYMGATYAYDACRQGKFIGATIVPCQVSDDGIGYLPGELEEKLDPNIQPIKNALRNYLIYNDKDVRKAIANMRKFGATDARQSYTDECIGDNPTSPQDYHGGGKKGNGQRKSGYTRDNASGYPANRSGKSDHSGKSERSSQSNGSQYQRNSNNQHQKSIKSRLANMVDEIIDNWFSIVPIAYARGRDFAEEIVLYDEFQDQNRVQADTLLKRLGANGKIIITGDIEQIHAAYLDRQNNGLVYARRLLMGSPMVAQVTFVESEVVRHPLVREIAERQRTHHEQKALPQE